MSITDALMSPAFTLLGAPVSWAEVVGDLTGLACVWLVARQHLWNWPIGILNNAFFMLLFLGSKLYAEATLQVIFAVLGAYGWWSWARGGTEGGDTLAVRTTRPSEWGLFAALTVALTWAFAALLASHTDSPAPVPDSLVLVMSLVATYGQAKKLLESWWVWIAVDLISVPLYVNRRLYPTAALYVLFLLLCVAGLRAWRRELRRAIAVPG